MVNLDLALIALYYTAIRATDHHVNCYLAALAACDIFVAMMLSLFMLSNGVSYEVSLIVLGCKDLLFLAFCCRFFAKTSACLACKYIYIISAVMNFTFILPYFKVLYSPSLYLTMSTVLAAAGACCIMILTKPLGRIVHAG